LECFYGILYIYIFYIFLIFSLYKNSNQGFSNEKLEILFPSKQIGKNDLWSSLFGFIKEEPCRSIFPVLFVVVSYGVIDVDSQVTRIVLTVTWPNFLTSSIWISKQSEFSFD